LKAHFVDPPAPQGYQIGQEAPWGQAGQAGKGAGGRKKHSNEPRLGWLRFVRRRAVVSGLVEPRIVPIAAAARLA
jgi:hypothetical protein